ncbi:hypothetical protein BC831DRAFT_37744 [Entophlyctis helioformis]|nr:hypothetical protein BC831DRAFT_37744 [Entophlyctis helioformis]
MASLCHAGTPLGELNTLNVTLPMPTLVDRCLPLLKAKRKRRRASKQSNSASAVPMDVDLPADGPAGAPADGHAMDVDQPAVNGQNAPGPAAGNTGRKRQMSEDPMGTENEARPNKRVCAKARHHVVSRIKPSNVIIPWSSVFYGSPSLTNKRRLRAGFPNKHVLSLLDGDNKAIHKSLLCAMFPLELRLQSPLLSCSGSAGPAALPGDKPLRQPSPDALSTKASWRLKALAPLIDKMMHNVKTCNFDALLNKYCPMPLNEMLEDPSKNTMALCVDHKQVRPCGMRRLPTSHRLTAPYLHDRLDRSSSLSFATLSQKRFGEAWTIAPSSLPPSSRQSCCDGMRRCPSKTLSRASRQVFTQRGLHGRDSASTLLAISHLLCRSRRWRGSSAAPNQPNTCRHARWKSGARCCTSFCTGSSPALSFRLSRTTFMRQKQPSTSTAWCTFVMPSGGVSASRSLPCTWTMS